MDVLTFIFVALFGVVVGILSGLFGIGGGTVIIPMLRLVFGLSILSSTATSLFVIAPTAISGGVRSFRQGGIDIKSALLIGGFGAAAAIGSSYLSDYLHPVVITVAAMAVILFSAYRMLATVIGSSKTQNAGAGENESRIKTEAGFLVARICLGLFAGFVAGIVGVGGGFIIVPIAIAYFGFTFQRASGTSLLAIAIIAVPGIVVHALLGHIEYLYGVALMIGSIPGANVGARLIARIPDRVARISFAILLAVFGILLIIESVL